MMSAFLEILADPIRRAGRQERDEIKENGAQNREHEIHPRPRGGDKDRIEFRAAQRAEIDRHGLGVAEQERRVGDQQQSRQQDRAERVDVLQRIEAHPALAPGGIVSEQMRDEAMRRLVKGDRQNERNDPGRDLIEGQGES